MRLSALLRYETLRIARSPRVLLLGCALVLGVFAAWEGAGWKRFQTEALAKARSLELEQRQRHLADARAADTGLGPVSLGSPLHGVSLYWTRRYAYHQPSPLASLAVGQSDVEPYYAVFSGVEPNVLLFPEEIRNPLGLLHGRWDAKFLVTLLVPLLVIAFGFDLAAEERESGTLRFLGAGVRSLPKYYFLRAAAQLGFIALAGLGGFLVALAVFDPAAFAAGAALLYFTAAVLAYLTFWSAICLAVNTLGKSAGFNLAVLILLWAALTFLVPTGLERLSRMAHPMPSRNEQALAWRELEGPSAQTREGKVEALRRSRPDLFDTSRIFGRKAAPLTWYPGILAEQAFLIRARDSSEQIFRRIRGQQEAWTSVLRPLVPTLALEDYVLRLSGRAPSDFHLFAANLERYRAGVRETTWPRLLQSRAYSPEEIETLPRWEGTRAGGGCGLAATGSVFLSTLLPALVLSAWAWARLRRPT